MTPEEKEAFRAKQAQPATPPPVQEPVVQQAAPAPKPVIKPSKPKATGLSDEEKARIREHFLGMKPEAIGLPPESKQVRSPLADLKEKDIEKAVATLPPALPPAPQEPKELVPESMPAGERFDALIHGMEEKRVREAARSADVRARAQDILRDKGMAAVLGLDPTTATVPRIAKALSETTPDAVVEKRKRYLTAQYQQDQVAAGKPSGVSDTVAASIDRQAKMEVATLRTVGLWTGGILSPFERNPESVLDAMKPTAEVLGITKEGKPVVRHETPGQYLGDVLTMPAYLAESTGLPAAAARRVFGEAEDAKQYDIGNRVFDPSAIRERRTFSQDVRETKPEGVVQTGAAALAGAAADVFFPDVVSTVVAPVIAIKGARTLKGALAVRKAMKAYQKSEKALTEAEHVVEIALREARTVNAGDEAVRATARQKLEAAERAYDTARTQHTQTVAMLQATKDARLPGAAKVVPRIALDARQGQEALRDAARQADAEHVVAELRKQADSLDANMTPLPKPARDAIEDAALAAVPAEQPARDTFFKMKFGDTIGEIRGVARRLSAASGFSAKNAVRLLKAAADAVESGSITHTAGAAFGGVLLDDIYNTTTKLHRSAMQGPREIPSATRALIDVLADSIINEPSPQLFETADKVALQNRAALKADFDAYEKALEATRTLRDARQISAKEEEALAKLSKSVAVRVEKGGIAMTPMEVQALHDVFKSDLSGHSLLAEHVLDKDILARRFTDAIAEARTSGVLRAEHLAGLDKTGRSILHAANVTSAKLSPLNEAGRDILEGKLASRPPYEGALAGIRKKSADILKSFFIGGNEYSAWEKAHLSRAMRNWVVEVTRGYEEIGAAVSRLTGQEKGFAYLSEKVGTAGEGMLDEGSRIHLFLMHFDEERADFTELLRSLSGFERTGPRLLENIEGTIVGKVRADIRDAIKEMREAEERLVHSGGELTDSHQLAEELTNRITKAVAPIVRHGEDTSDFWRTITGFVAANVYDMQAAERAFGDGVLFTENDVKAFETIADGKLLGLDATPGRRAAEEILGKRRWAVPTTDFTELPISRMRREALAEGEMRAASLRENGARGATNTTRISTDVEAARQMRSRVEWAAALDRQVYVPQKVREQMVKALEKAYVPQSTLGKQILSWWKLSVTRGVFVTKPGYFVNNVVGDFEQVFLAFGLQEALKTAIRTELGNLVPIFASGGFTRALPLKGPARGAVELATGLGLSTLAGKQPEKTERLIHLLAAVPEKGAAAVSRLLGLASFRIEVRSILEGSGTVRLSEHFWTGKELREIAVRTGVFDSFDKAELGEDVLRLISGPLPFKLGDTAAQGAQHLAETISLRRRLGLYATLIEQGMTPEEAGRGVVKALFDYRASLSDGEQNFLRQVILPFWAWQKNMNRLVLGGMTSPFGTFRVKQAISAGRVVQEWGENQDWFTGTPAVDGDDIGILNSRMTVGKEQDAYEKFKRFRKAVEAKQDAPTPKEWNALLVGSNPREPATLAWTQDPDVPEADRLTEDDLHLLLPFVAPWVTPEMQKSYLRDRAKVRVYALTTDKDGKVDASRFWYTVAPHSGVDQSLQWSATILAAMANIVPGPGYSKTASTESILHNLVQPERAPLLGPVISTLGGKPISDRIASPLGKFMLNTGIGDGLVTVDNSKGQDVYRVHSVPLAYLFEVTPSLADINRVLLQNEADGKAYTPDQLRGLVSGLGVSTPTITPTGAMTEELDREYDASQLPAYARIPQEGEPSTP